MVDLVRSLPSLVRQATHKLRAKQVAFAWLRLLILESHLSNEIWPSIQIAIPRHIDKEGGGTLRDEVDRDTEVVKHEGGPNQTRKNTRKAATLKERNQATGRCQAAARVIEGVKAVVACVWALRPRNQEHKAPLPVSVANRSLRFVKTAAPQQPFQQARVAIALDAKTNGGRDPLKGSESDVHKQSNKVQEAKETNNHTPLSFWT